MAELASLPARVVERQLEASLTPRPGRLERASAAGRTAAAWAAAGEHWSQVAQAELALAAVPGILPNARRSRLERADEALRRALAATAPGASTRAPTRMPRSFFTATQRSGT
jgi:hypothetical protein